VSWEGLQIVGYGFVVPTLKISNDDLSKIKCWETSDDSSTPVESSGDEESLGEDASKQGRMINAIDADVNITLISVVNNEMFDVDFLGGEEVFVAEKNENVVEEVADAAQVSTAAKTITITNEEITLAQELEELKTSKPMVKGIVFQEPEELVMPKKKDQIKLDEEAAKKLQVELMKMKDL
nr:hypothetical protein [Tanacetum cinerariifolium]